MLLATRVGIVALVLLALLALRGKRWAYAGVVVLGLLYFPAQAHFQVHAPTCDLATTMTTRVLLLSLHNYVYIALFAGFYWVSWVQLEEANARVFWALVATLLAGALLEVAQGMTAVKGARVAPCRLRDLIPVGAGALGAALLLALWSRLRRKPAYVRIVRPRAAPRPAAAARPAAAPPKPVAPPRAVAPLPGAVPPPPDFSPGPDVPLATPARVPAPPRPEVAPLQRLRDLPKRVWAVLRGRRRTVVVGVGVLALVGAGALVVLRLPAPAPTVVEQPTAPPPPPPRPLQVEQEGYYEPSYNFSVGDQRFTRLTLRPEPFVTFSRLGTRQEAGCATASIGPTAVHLRCEVDRVGIVTIDGRFPSRFATSRLDQPVLSAIITVTNTRGETLYRARDSFTWHEPD